MRMFAVYVVIFSATFLSQPCQLQAGMLIAVTYRGKPLSFYVLQSRTPDLRAEAIRSIGNFGPQAVSAIPRLAEGLKDGDVEVRIASAWALSQVSAVIDEAAVKALAQSLSDENPEVRSLSAVALRAAGPKAGSAVPVLISALSDPALYVRVPAADALGNIGSAARAAVGPLIECLKMKDEQTFVLRSAATALGNIGADAHSALPALVETLKLTRASYAAKEAILRINGEPVPSYW